MEGLAIGRIVHFVQADGQHRAAVVVRLFEGSDQAPHRVQLVVFHDGDNDGVPSCIEWATSVPFSETASPATWHWPERA